MKELTIEEKAKRYDEAIERSKKELQTCGSSDCDAAKQIFRFFPELKKKEDEDERIKEALLNTVKYYHPNESPYMFGISQEQIIAWLEKQGNQKSKEEVDNLHNYLYGEHKLADKVEPKDYNSIDPHFGKPIDKIEPKFKVGDWVTDGIGKCQICFIDDTQYWYSKNCILGNIEFIDKRYHLWTIQDAKDGDVLEFGDHGRLVVGIVSYVNKTTGKVDVNCLLENNNFKLGNYYNLDTIKPHPANKEQIETLMKAMADAGWEFDLEKKELKKIEDEIEIPFGAKDSELQEVTYYIPKGFHAEIDDDKVVIKKGENPAAWSEEDEKNSLDVKCLIGSYRAGDDEYRLDSWIDSLKGRVQPKQEWNKEDEAIINEAVLWLNALCDYLTVSSSESVPDVKDVIDKLKSLKDRVQPKAELTQLDKNILEAAIAFVEQNNHFNYWRGVDKRTVLSALYSLRPQKYWKSSKGRWNNSENIVPTIQH